MSATAVRIRPARVRVGRAPTAASVFAAAAGLCALHGLDAAFVSSWRGESASTGAPAAIVAVLFAAGAVGVWPRLPRGPRALVAFAAGLVAAVAGGLAVWQVSVGSAEGGAWTGVLLVPAGAAMLGCAVVTMAHPPGRRLPARWGRRAGGVVAAALALLWVVMPAGTALFVSGKPRSAVPAGALAIAHENVRFRSSDGLRLAGWYVPSRTGAAIVVVHGGGGSRVGAVAHARMLARHGYGVLLYDARGRGESAGAPDAIGWTWQRDVAGALAWLKHRPDVDPRRIGGLGLSTGAEALLQAAAQRGDLHAVVADGAEARNVSEAARVASVTDMPFWATMYAANAVLTAAAPAPDLGRLVGRLRAPALLIASGRAEEARFGRIYAERSHGRARLWQVPDAGHTHALRVHPQAYEARVSGFFNHALRLR